MDYMKEYSKLLLKVASQQNQLEELREQIAILKRIPKLPVISGTVTEKQAPIKEKESYFNELIVTIVCIGVIILILTEVFHWRAL